MNIEAILKKVGLTDNEVKVYKHLLILGETTASKLGKETGIERRTVYDIVQKLLRMGLVSFIEKDNKKYYKPINPYKFVDILEEKEEHLRKIRHEFEKMVPELEELIK